MKKQYSIVSTDKYGNEKKSESMDDFYHNDYVDHIQNGGTDEDYISPDEWDKQHGIR